MSQPPRFLNSIYDSYPDDDSTKAVYLQAAGLSYSGIGDRHVVLWWSNGETLQGKTVTQVLQLTGQAGNYSYYVPVAQVGFSDHINSNLQVSLGEFTRQQRDQILQIALDTKFFKTSVTNGCRVWTRDIMETMVAAELISQATFDDAEKQIPLVKRKQEE